MLKTRYGDRGHCGVGFGVYMGNIAGGSQRALGWGVFLAAILIASGLIYRAATTAVLNCDPFLYGQVAKEILAGKRLYAETWQDKPPLAFFIYALPQWLGYRSYSALGFLQGIWIAAAGLIFFAAFRRELPAALACLAFSIFSPMIAPDTLWPSTEHFSNPFIAILILIGYLIYRDKRFSIRQCVLLGVISVIAFNIRQNAAVAALLAIGAIAICPNPLRQKFAGAAAMAISAALVWGIILLIVWRIGDLRGYFYTVFKYPILYARGTSDAGTLPLPHGQLGFAMIIAMALVLYPALRGPNRAYLATALVLGILICLMPKKPYMHYWGNLFPFLTLGIGLSMQSAVMPSIRARRGICAAIIAVGLGQAAIQFHKLQDQPPYAAFKHAAELADQLAPPHATLLVVGAMGSQSINFASELPAANTYWVLFQLTPPWGDCLPVPPAKIIEQYLQHPPGVIVIEKDFLSILSDPNGSSYPDRLVYQLYHDNSYETRGDTEGFIILVRGGDGS
jgi:hypothetical protein